MRLRQWVLAEASGVFSQTLDFSSREGSMLGSMRVHVRDSGGERVPSEVLVELLDEAGAAVMSLYGADPSPEVQVVDAGLSATTSEAETTVVAAPSAGYRVRMMSVVLHLSNLSGGYADVRDGDDNSLIGSKVGLGGATFKRDEAVFRHLRAPAAKAVKLWADAFTGTTEIGGIFEYVVEPDRDIRRPHVCDGDLYVPSLGAVARHPETGRLYEVRVSVTPVRTASSVRLWMELDDGHC